MKMTWLRSFWSKIKNRSFVSTSCKVIAAMAIIASICTRKAPMLETLRQVPKSKPTSKNTMKIAKFVWSLFWRLVSSLVCWMAAITPSVSSVSGSGVLPTTNALQSTTSAHALSVVRIRLWSFPATTWWIRAPTKTLWLRSTIAHCRRSLANILIGAMDNVPSLIVASMSTDSKMASCMSIPGRIIRCLLMAFGRVTTSWRWRIGLGCELWFELKIYLKQIYDTF